MDWPFVYSHRNHPLPNGILNGYPYIQTHTKNACAYKIYETPNDMDIVVFIVSDYIKGKNGIHYFQYVYTILQTLVCTGTPDRCTHYKI